LGSAENTKTALETSKILLNSLCDLQVLTGTAIVISAAAQLPEISFYHERVAMYLWGLTLNSFWAARTEQFCNDTEVFNARDVAEDQHSRQRNAGNDLLGDD
jgi:hypothetical protein